MPGYAPDGLIAPLAPAARFDLIVATNILVYYDAFDQTLALANVSSMLRPGGFFLVNSPILPSSTMELLDRFTTNVDFDRQRQIGDSLIWYRRRHNAPTQ